MPRPERRGAHAEGFGFLSLGSGYAWGPIRQCAAVAGVVALLFAAGRCAPAEPAASPAVSATSTALPPLDASTGTSGPAPAEYVRGRPCRDEDPRAMLARLAGDGGAYRQGNVEDAGGTAKLEPAVVQRVVRAHFPVMHACYLRGLARNPRLQGRVTTKFVIDSNGSVVSHELVCTSLPDDVAVDCVVNAFGDLSFPKPDGSGTVTVVYPIIFNPK